MGRIEWAPLRIPAERRIQTFIVGVYFALTFGLGLLSHVICAICFFWGNVYLKLILLAYGLWIYLDRERAQNCVRGSGIRWMRDNIFWRYFRGYFPVELVKTADLPPNRNYLLACFPHGVISIGLFTNMCADISKWNELFPKVRVHLATLAMHFNTPIWREFIQSWAMVSVGKTSLKNNLMARADLQDSTNADGCTARAIGVIIGGAEEALDAKPGKYILTIKKRKGFIKVAMQTGAAIVPSISFGEVDVYDQVDNPPGSLLRRMQSFVKQLVGISPLVFVGRGFFQYTVGLLPRRRRIVQVVGAPMDVPQCDNPKNEDVDKVHEQFMKNLQNLFEAHKSKYISNPDDVVFVLK